MSADGVPAGTTRHVLTVLHSAERTGPPLLALRFLRWLRAARPQWTLSTLSLGGGTDLLADFEELGETLVGAPLDPAGSLQHRARAAVHNAALRRRLRRLGPVDLAHVHCAGSMRVLDVLPPAPVLCHLHELSVGLDLHLRARARANLGRAQRYVAVSDSVRSAFLERVEVDSELVERRWGFVDLDELPDDRTRAGLEMPEGAALVVASGVRHWRKAPELFVRTAARLTRARPDRPWRFVWVGGARDGTLERLVERAGLGDVVQFIEHRRDSLRWVAAADVFFLSAREDAFPLVCVEAAALGVPLVTFDSGGAPELVRAAGCGTVVPFPDVDAAADAIAELLDNPGRRRLLGDAGAEFARAQLSVARAGPEVFRTVAAAMGRC